MFSFRIIFLLISLLSCSQKEVKSNNKNIYYASVHEEQSLIEKSLPLIQSGSLERKQFGPKGPSKNLLYYNHDESNPNVIGLFFGPCLYRSINYIEVLKKFEERKVPIHIVSGVGMGAVVASLLAKGTSPELIEWKFYKLHSLLSSKKVYSNDWSDILINFLRKEFNGLNIENMKKTLILPIYNSKKRKVEYLKRGNLFEALRINFDVVDRGNKSLYYSPLLSYYRKTILVTKFGVDKLFVINGLGEKIYFNRPSDYIFGLYAKAIGFLDKFSNNENIQVLNIPNGKVPLDSYRPSKGVGEFLDNSIDDIILFSKGHKKNINNIGLEYE